jgi:type I restriction enzyme S subunit
MTSKMTKDAKKQSRPLPPGWQWARLGDYLTDLQPGIACGDKSLTEGVPHLRMNNISAKGEIDLSLLWRISVSADDLKHYRLLPGDILFNNTNSVELVGKTALFNIGEGDFVYSNHLTRVRTKYKELRPGWLALYLRFIWERRYFERVADRWAGQSAVRDNILKSLSILLPAPVQQDVIISHLNTQITEVKQMRQAAQRQLEATKAMVAAIHREVFESSEARSWTTKPLVEVLESGPDNGLFKTQEFFGWGTRLVNVSDLYLGLEIEQNRLGRVETSEDEQRRFAVGKGDVFFCRSSLKFEGVGQCCYIGDVQEPTVFECHIMRVKPDMRKILPEFLAFYCQAGSARSYLLEVARRGTMTTLNQDDLKKLPVPVPTGLERQQAIWHMVADKLEEIPAIQAAIQRQLEAINALPGALLRDIYGGFEPPTISESTEGFPNR